MPHRHPAATAVAALACAFAGPTAHASEPATPPAATAPQGEPVAMMAMRASVVIRDGDEDVLRRGLSLHIARMGGGDMLIVEYGLKDGRITYAATSGSLGDGDRRAIEKAVARLQKKLGG